MAYTRVYQNRINWKNAPNTTTPLGQTNLNKMDYALNQIDLTLSQWNSSKVDSSTYNSKISEIQSQINSLNGSKASTTVTNNLGNQITELGNQITNLRTTKAEQSSLLQCVKTITYNPNTGVFVFTWQNGTTKTVDLNVEKIPVSFTMSSSGVITMTNADGTKYTANIASIIKPYNFDDGTIIDFTKTTDSSGNYHVTADIKNGSITENKLQPNFLADCRNYASNAHNSAQLAQSYTKGDTELRPGEETDNATYYYQEAKAAEAQAKIYRDQAEAIAGIQIATTEVFGIVKPDGNTIDINNGILSTGIPDSQWSYIQNLYQ